MGGQISIPFFILLVSKDQLYELTKPPTIPTKDLVLLSFLLNPIYIKRDYLV